MRVSGPRWRVVTAALAVCAFVGVTAGEALAVEERTLGGMTTNSGKSCTLTVRVTSTTKSTVVLSNIDWLTQLSCTAGTNGWPIDSFLKSALYENGLRGRVVDDAESDFCAETPAEPCTRSGTFSTGIPTRTYDFTGQAAILRAHLDLNPGGADDWWTSWPPQCTAFFDTFGTPGPRILQCSHLLVRTTGV